MHTFGLIFLAALLLTVVLRLWLAARHAAHVAAHRGAVPAQFSTVITLDAHQRAADYTCAKTRFAMLSVVVEAAIALAFTFGGGTFTDIVAVDDETGAIVTTKTPSTPADPAEGFLAGIEKVLAKLGESGDSIGAVSHGTTVATNKLLEGKVENLGLITTYDSDHGLGAGLSFRF